MSLLVGLVSLVMTLAILVRQQSMRRQLARLSRDHFGHPSMIHLMDVGLDKVLKKHPWPWTWYYCGKKAVVIASDDHPMTERILPEEAMDIVNFVGLWVGQPLTSQNFSDV